MKLRLIAAAAALHFAAPALAQPQGEQPAAPPRLIVAIAVDQFSADLFAQYRQHFAGGLARLSRAIVFPAGYQSHAATETCPGHSTILTGSRPARTGIIANNWFDLGVERDDVGIYCAEDERVPGSTSRNYTASPVHLRVPALGDRMKEADPASRVVVVSGKDRSAMMLGGHRPDQRWWWHRGAFIGHAGAPVPAAVSRTNARVADIMSRPREPFPLPPVCEARSRAIPLEGGADPVGAGRFARGPLAPDERDDFRLSPDLDAAVLGIAGDLRDEMRLGQGRSTDLLVVGLSANDYVGHTYGAGGSEMCIQLLALDAALGAFFERLDATGIDYLVMLTADHGGLDIPERARQQGILDAARADPALDVERIDAALRQSFGLAEQALYGEYVSGDMYVDRDLAPDLRRRVRDEAVRRYRAHPQVAAAFTREEIAAAPAPAGPPQTWTLLQRARASYDAERSGDFLVLLKPLVTGIHDTSHGYVAGHGSPWDYDRRVPILFWRRGLTPFEQPLGVETVDILPTLAATIGVAIPRGEIDGRCLDLLEGPESSCPGE